MSRHPSRPTVRRLALINPTKFLGNLLLAGELIQHLNAWCQREQIALLLVLDASFQGLVDNAFPGAHIVYYPRHALGSGVPGTNGVRLWWQCVQQVRNFRADLAFSLEEDSVCHRLTHFSGARHKVSSTTARYRFGFDEVLDVPRTGREPGRQSIWYSFADVLQRLGLPVCDTPGYLKLDVPPPGPALLTVLCGVGLDPAQPLAVVHAGASKVYKQWPVEHFTELVRQLSGRGYQVALVGAGEHDTQVNRTIIDQLAGAGELPGSAAQQQPVGADLSNKLTLSELAQLVCMASLMVGNDSGPSHLGSALGVPGVVIFGPTNISIWRPLGRQTTILDKKALCDVTCTRHQCLTGYLCLRSVTPRDVISALFPEG